MARYSDEFRASAVAMLQMQGHPDKLGALAEVARYFNVPQVTLSRWYRRKLNPPSNKTVQLEKGKIVQLIKREVYAAFKEMPLARPDADYRALVTAIGILIDKMQLLEGEPTARVEWRSEAIEDIKARRVTYEALAEAFDDSLAAELFRAAGVPVPIRES